ncbi:MAG: primosomal protein N' [Hyphomicrobiales bacterium]|nr:primosomal protein N' [Hyphomicrobiales bacterium]
MRDSESAKSRKQSNPDGAAHGGSAPETVSVLLPVAAGSPFSYRAPEGTPCPPGTWVKVPLGPREVIATVWDAPQKGEAEDKVAPEKLRPVAEVFPAAPLPEKARRFIDWVADYTLSDPGAVLRMVIRSPEALLPPKQHLGLRITGIEPDRMTAARTRVLQLARNGLVWPKATLATEAGVTASVVSGLEKLGTLTKAPLPSQKPLPLNPDYDHTKLTEAQGYAAADLRKSVADGAFAVTLLDGVTGSGKTEVYFEAIAEALRKNRQILVLIPEIALTAQFLDRFESRFGNRPALWHSDVAAKQRETVWRGVLNGGTRVVVGARSALFLPFADLGLIVVDEEHDPAFKQEDGVIYHGRDMAVLRGRIEDCPVILASATPSIESQVNAESGKYRHLTLPDRFAGRALPDITVIDLRAYPPEKGNWLAPQLVTAVKETLEAGDQALLFLNRRGYAPLTLCRTCGHRFACPQCTAWLTEHRFREKLTCHHCGFEMRTPKQCPSCGAEESLVACGPGVERIAEEAHTLFPDARLSILSSDLLHGVHAIREGFAAIEEHRVDLIVGTQLIAKGHNFPQLTLVGVVDGDMGLGFGDLRASERTFQLLSQVTGRAGRHAKPGRAFIQTHMPDHPVMMALASGDRTAFYGRETNARKATGWPPFARLAAVIVTGKDQRATEADARALARAAPPHGNAISVLGPAPAPIAVIRGRHRYRLLVKAARSAPLHTWLRTWLQAAPRPQGSIRRTVDIDPQSFL